MEEPKNLDTPIIDNYSSKSLKEFLEDYKEDKLVFSIQLEGKEKSISSKISIKELSNLLYAHGETPIIRDIGEHIFQQLVSKYSQEREWNKGAQAPDIEEILDDLDKVKEEKGEDAEDLSSTGLLRKELMKNFEEDEGHSPILNFNNLTGVAPDENDNSTD